MANQPPVRPWFRLASLRAVQPTPAPAPAPETRPPAPAPAQPEARPPVALPTFRTSSAPSSPQTRAPPPAEEPVAPPPVTVERTSVPSSPVVKRVPSPVQKGPISAPSSVPSDMNGKAQSPKIKQAVQPPAVESPKVRPAAPPPSPLVLPPAQTMKTSFETELPVEAEAEQKRVLVQKTVEKPKQRVNSEKSSILHHEKHGGHMKEAKKAEESGTRVITIAGENRGAFMEVIQSPNKHKKKGNGKEEKKEGSESEKSSEEGDAKSSKKKEKDHRGKASRAFPMAAFLNSNVQSVNNSLMYHSSCSQHDPGVRFALSKKPLGVGEAHQIKEEKN